MLVRISSAVLLLLCLLVPRTAGAQEKPDPGSPSDAFRASLALTGGLADMQRSHTESTEERGLAYGAELRLHPYSPHGFVGGVTHASGIFGPEVTIIDAAYSWRLVGSSRLDGLTGAIYIDLGPSMGLVSRAKPEPDHTVLGGRATLTVDAQLYSFVLGAAVGYRGGVPLTAGTDPWESALTALVRAGIVFDTGR
jgi:hypothetical protein